MFYLLRNLLAIIGLVVLIAAGYAMVDCIHLPVHFWRYILVREYP